MNFEGLQPWKIARWGGEANWDDPDNIPNGIALRARDCRFRAESVATRFARKNTMVADSPSDITGLEVLNVLGPEAIQIVLAFLSGITAGELYMEAPAGSGVLLPLADFPGVPAGLHMMDALAYNRCYMTFTDYLKGYGPPQVLDGPTGAITPISQNVIAGLWTPGTAYQIGDVVRTSQNSQRWFRCIVSGVAGMVEPTWPTLNGYYDSITGQFQAATAQDPNGPSQWTEWTPGITAFVPPPPLDGQMISIKGQPGAPNGAIAANQDVYVYVSYFNQNGETQWVGPYPYLNTAATDVLELFFQFEGEVPGPTVPPSYGAIGYGGPRIPQWLASVLGVVDPLVQWPGNPNFAVMNVYVAAVAHGSAVPTLFGLYAAVGIESPVVITSIPVAGLSVRTVNTAQLTTLLYVGEGGTRQAIMLRQDNNESLTPADMNSAIPVVFQGQVMVNILNITRDGSGNVNATVTDISQFGSGQPVLIQVPGDSSFNGDVQLTGIVPGALPSGILQWVSTDHTPSTQTAGTASTIAGPPPVAVLPPGGDSAALDILALTVAGAQTGGPYNYIPAAEPAVPASAFVTSLQSVVAGSGDAVLSPNRNTVAYFTPGTYAAIAKANPSSFDGLILVGALYNNTIVFATAGTGGGIQTNCTITIQQELPTAQPDPGTLLESNLSGINRNASGYVSARIKDVGILEPGHRVQIQGTGLPSLNEAVTLISVAPDLNDLGGTLTWQSATSLVSTGYTGTLSGVPGIILNFDDNSLSASADVTDQLTAIGAPLSIDIQYSHSLDRMVYTPENSSSLYFSNIGDAENIDNPGGILAVDQNNGFKMVCFREMQDGELIALKENGGYLITSSDNTPNEWTPTSRWGGKDATTLLGPVGPDAAKVGKDFMIIFVRGLGPHRYFEGELTWIGHEKQGTWDQLNWDAAAEVCVEIDELNKRVFFSVPLNGSLTNNFIEVCDYSNGWADPLIVMLDGTTKPNRYARRWSEWPLACRKIKAVERTLAIPVDSRINKRQMLFGLTRQDDSAFVQMEVPDTYSDDGFVANGETYNQVGIDWQYTPAYVADPKCQILQFEGYVGRARGNGLMYMTQQTDDPTFGFNPIDVPSVDLTVPTGKTALTPIKFTGDFVKHIENERLTINFNNGAKPGSWGELHEYLIYSRVKYPARRGRSSGV